MRQGAGTMYNLVFVTYIYSSFELMGVKKFSYALRTKCFIKNHIRVIYFSEILLFSSYFYTSNEEVKLFFWRVAVSEWLSFICPNPFDRYTFAILTFAITHWS